MEFTQDQDPIGSHLDTGPILFSSVSARSFLGFSDGVQLD